MSFTANIDEIVAQNANGLLGARPNWKRVRLREVATILNGFPFESAKFKKDCGTPLLRIRDVVRGETETFYDGEFDPTFLVNRGELVVGMDGDFNSGRWRGEPALLNQRVCKITVDSARYSPRFLEYVLPGYLAAINADTPSVTVKHLSSRTISDIPLPDPPLDEQQRIVAEIEKQFTRLDAGVTSLKRVQIALKRYRASVLKAACEGRLVPTEAELARKENRSYETGEQLLQRILKERRENWNGKGKYKEPAASNVVDLPSLPEGWTWATLEELLSELRNGWSYKPDAAAGIPILRISAVRPLSVNLDDVRYLSGEATHYADYILHECELLFTRYNGNPSLTGVCGVVPPLAQATVYPDKLIRVKLVADLCDPTFVCVTVNVGASRQFLASRARTTAGQTGISGSDLRQTPIPLAPLAEQQRIVAEIERRLSLGCEVEAGIAAELQRSNALRRSILNTAFSM